MACALCIALLAGCASHAGGDASQGARETELLAAVDTVEAQLRESPTRVRDDALTAHVHALACRIAPADCPRLRVYVIARAGFVANVWPNGMLQISSGALLRIDDDAELAAVLAHEIAHFRAGHALIEWQRAHRAGFVAELRRGSARDLRERNAFTREHEAEADRLGGELLIAAGFDPAAGARLYAHVLDEWTARGGTSGSPDQATHPELTERIAAWRAMPRSATRAALSSRRDTELLDHIAAHRATWLDIELANRQDAGIAVLLRRLRARDAERPHDDLDAALARLAREQPASR
jgi:beta-barrel assembly-enhancing protease